MNQVIKTKPIPTCPKCGAKMVLHRPKPSDGWSPFWGCMDWPDCKGTRDILPDGRPAEDDDWLEELYEISMHEGNTQYRQKLLRRGW